MTSSLHSRLLLDRLSVHGPMVSIGCNVIRHHRSGSDEFHWLVCPRQAESELLPFLLDSGLVENTRHGLRLSRAYRPDWSPQLNLLRLLHGRTDINFAFRFIWESLLTRPEWGNRFLNRDDLWPVLNQVQPGAANLPSLNQNRMASWLRIASWIGLVQPERSNTFCLLPNQRLLIDLVSSTITGGEEVSIARWVEDIESQFCRVTTETGNLHPGFASTLDLLEQNGQLDLKTYSDERLYLVGNQRVSHLLWRGEPGK